MNRVAAMVFGYACDGLVRAVHTAANRAIPDYVPYYGLVVSRAVWQARYVVREARSLGLLDEAQVQKRIAERDRIAGQRQRWTRGSAA